MTKRSRANDSIRVLRLPNWLGVALLCLSTLALWGCEGPQEPKETPATAAPANPAAGPDTGTANAKPKFSFSYKGKSGTSFEINESENRAPINVTVTLAKPWVKDLRINYGVPSRSSATRDVDFAVVGAEFVGQGTASWGATLKMGETSITLEQGFVIGDAIYEGPETLSVIFQISDGSGREELTVEFTIVDDEKPPSVHLAFANNVDATDNKGKLKESAGSITLHATLVGSESSPFPIRVPLTFASTDGAGGATIDVDFRVPGEFTPDDTSYKPDGCPMVIGNENPNPSVLVIPPNTKELDFAILVNDDFVTELGVNGNKEEVVTITAHTPNIRAQNVICGSLISVKTDPNSVVATRPLTLTIVDDETNGRLNPTGVTTCAVANQSSVPCTGATDFPNQDGFTGTAISSLEKYKDTACVIDTNTKLVWETKTAPTPPANGRHDFDNFYTWRDERANINGGSEGLLGGENTCKKTEVSCDTAEYIKRVNGEVYCGHLDWRLPTVKELLSLVHHGLPEPGSARRPRIDTSKFQYTGIGGYWSMTPSALFASSAWVVDFSDGRVYPVDKGEVLRPYFIRLVRNAD